MDSIGVASARSKVARSREDGLRILEEIGLPLILRPSFTLAAKAAGRPRLAEFLEKLDRALFLSPTKDVLVEESLIGWKEYELEVVRDRADNVIIICSIENFDPMGVQHGRQHHGRAGADADRSRVPESAQPIDPHHSARLASRRAAPNIQFAVNPVDDA